MRILHLTDEPWDSGLTAYALQIAALQQKSGERVVVGVRSGKRPEASAKALGLQTYPVNSFFRLWRLFSLEAWDIVNVHTGRMHTRAVLANWLRTVLGSPARAVVRTRGDARSVRINFLTRMLYRLTAGSIAASAHIGRQYEEGFQLAEESLRVVYPSVSVDQVWARPSSKNIGILGRLDAVKGHTAFIEAAAQVLKKIPDATFCIAGKEAGVTYQLLRNQARELGIESSIKFSGFLPSVDEFLHSCAVGVIASLGSEEVSRACLEWMGAGRAVVGTLVGSIPELVEPGETGFLVPPGDSTAMGEAIISLLGSAETVERMGQNALALARRRFGPETQLSQTMEFYRDVFARSQHV